MLQKLQMAKRQIIYVTYALEKGHPKMMSPVCSYSFKQIRFKYCNPNDARALLVDVASDANLNLDPG